MTKITQVFKFLFLLAVLTNFQNGFAQTTYTVTSASKDGPGSINEAINMANVNPGPDIIEFTPGLQIDASHPDFVGLANSFMLNVTESVTIDGKGGALNGSQKWIRSDGVVNDLTFCPGDLPTTTILRRMPGFINVGAKGQDNSAIAVTIKNLSIKQFNAIASVRENATLNLENFKADEIWSSLRCSERGLFEASSGASLSLKNSNFTNSVNWASDGSGTAILSSNNAGDLTIENCLFYNINEGNQFLISWNGSSSSEVNVVSSRLLGVGGVSIFGATIESNIVNSTMVTDDTGTPRVGERIRNFSSGPMNITASSIRWNNNQCSAPCSISPLILIESGNGPINLSESAIGFTFTSDTGTLLATLGGTGTGFTADENTWIEPTSNQDANALTTITSQSQLLTSLPGFKPGVVAQIAYNDAELVAPDVSGALIDVINTPLLNPIDGNPITTDVLGNDRFDANGFRDIGAIQLSLAPILTITGSGDGFVDLAWQEPLHHNGEPIVRYEYQYVETGGGSPTVVDAGTSLTANVTSLTNGTTYEFSVRAVYNEGGNEVNGPFGNKVTATPYGNIGTPVLTAVPGDQEVALSWTLPDLGGHMFFGYTILWRVSGETEYLGGESINEIGTTTTTITGLKNGTSYEFAVSVNTLDGSTSERGLATATPIKPAGPVGDNCTLTVGYWSTHSEYGPSPYNATWAQLYAGADTDFFLSGNSYYEVINTAAKSNAYYILAKQYIAAELNFLQGADPTDAQDAFDQAKVLLQTYTPADIAGMKGKDPTRKMFVELGKLLESYNSGVIGPGHCPDMTSYDEIAKIDQNDKTDLDVFDATKNGLTKNYPNPFSSNTVISYELFNRGMVTINIYDLKGSLIKTLVNESQSVGPHEVIWNGTNHSNREMPNGVYFYHVRTNDKIFMNKMMIIKD